MGNRAVIKFAGENCGIYLHWNGGRDSVEAFLAYCRLRGHRCDGYGVSRLAQVIGNYLGGTLSLGIVATNMSLADLNPGDNGVYIVKDWEIVGRYPRGVREQRVYERTKMLIDIDKAQPVKEQFGQDFFLADLVPVADLKVGDQIFIMNHESYVKRVTVSGFGDGWVNGSDRTGLPFVNLYGDSIDQMKGNPNNYLIENEYRRIGGD